MELLEHLVSQLSSQQFLREFSFRRTTFKERGRGTREVADHVVWIEDLIFLFQLKERTVQGDPTDWLRNKVLKKATKQIRDTLALARERGPIPITNERGHSFDFTEARGAHAYNIVVFRQPRGDILILGPRYHISRSAGFIHIFNWEDYQEIATRLVTALELADYLAFRENLCRNRRPDTLPSELALLGQYLLDAGTADPAEDFASALLAQLDRRESYDLLWLMNGMAERIVFSTGGPASYYRVLGQLARLTRLELSGIKERLRLAMEAARDNRFTLPFRIVAPRLNCGFLILPITRDRHSARIQGLEVFSRAAKYDQRSRKQVGISIGYEPPEFLIDWCFVDGPWVENAEKVLF